jgi:hypothetical protein
MLRNVSLKKQISTPFWLNNRSISSFLPRTPYVFQQARRKVLHRTVFLRCTVIFAHEDNKGLQDTPRSGCPFGVGGDGREEPTIQLHTFLDGLVFEEIRISSSGEVEVRVGTTRSGVVGLAFAVLTLAAAFFFVFPAAVSVAAIDFGLGFLGPAVFLVAVTLGCECVSVTG